VEGTGYISIATINVQISYLFKHAVCVGEIVQIVDNMCFIAKLHQSYMGPVWCDAEDPYNAADKSQHVNVPIVVVGFSGYETA